MVTASWNRAKRLIKLVQLLLHTKPLTDAGFALALSVAPCQPVEMPLPNQGTKSSKFLQDKVSCEAVSKSRVLSCFVIVGHLYKSE